MYENNINNSIYNNAVLKNKRVVGWEKAKGKEGEE